MCLLDNANQMFTEIFPISNLTSFALDTLSRLSLSSLNYFRMTVAVTSTFFEDSGRLRVFFTNCESTNQTFTFEGRDTTIDV